MMSEIISLLGSHLPCHPRALWQSYCVNLETVIPGIGVSCTRSIELEVAGLVGIDASEELGLTD